MYKRKDVLTKETFEITISDETTVKTLNLNVYQPKIALIRKLTNVAKSKETEEIIENMLEILTSALKNNKEKVEISTDFLAEALDTDDMTALFEDYFKWVENLKKK